VPPSVEPPLDLTRTTSPSHRASAQPSRTYIVVIRCRHNELGRVVHELWRRNRAANVSFGTRYFSSLHVAHCEQGYSSVAGMDYV